MCNVPCQYCGDFEECEIRLKQCLTFKIYKEGRHIGNLTTTREEAQSFTFMNPDITLVLNTNLFDNDVFDNDLLN